jgi:uncharacterized protein YxjI
MKLYIRQKVFSWADRFTVMDETGQDKYYVEGELFSFGKKLHVCDMSGFEHAFIQQKVFSFLPRFYVFMGGQETAEIVKEFSFLHPRYSIEGLGWEVTGDFWAHDYEIVQGSRPVAAIHKEWMTWGDCYEVDIADARDEIAALSVVLAIDCVMDAESSAST